MSYLAVGNLLWQAPAGASLKKDEKLKTQKGGKSI